MAGLVVLAGAGCAEEQGLAGIVASGHVEATEVRVATKHGGTLEWFELEEGDRLAVGQEVARFDTVDLELTLQTTRVERRLAAAELALMEAGFRTEEVEEARAVVERARVDLAAARRDLTRFEALLERGSGTEKARDDALARVEIAQETLQAAQARLRLLESGFRTEEIEAARARVAAAEARIAQVQQQIDDAVVVSPVAGIVTEKLVEPGEILAPGTTLALVTDLQGAWLTAWVPEPDLGLLRLGEEATVVTDDGTRRPGRLVYVADEAEFTPKNVQTRDERVKLVYRIKVDLDNDDGFYKPGMPAEARFAAGSDGP